MTVATDFPDDNNSTLEKVINDYCSANPDYCPLSAGGIKGDKPQFILSKIDNDMKANLYHLKVNLGVWGAIPDSVFVPKIKSRIIELIDLGGIPPIDATNIAIEELTLWIISRMRSLTKKETELNADISR